MRLPLLVGLGLLSILVAWMVTDGRAPAGGPVGASRDAKAQGTWIVLSEAVADGVHQVVIVDRATEKMAVYHIGNKGEISLKGVRNLAWDLQLDQFNGARPTPEEIRAMLPAQPRAAPHRDGP